MSWVDFRIGLHRKHKHFPILKCQLTFQQLYLHLTVWFSSVETLSCFHVQHAAQVDQRRSCSALDFDAYFGPSSHYTVYEDELCKLILWPCWLICLFTHMTLGKAIIDLELFCQSDAGRMVSFRSVFGLHQLLRQIFDALAAKCYITFPKGQFQCSPRLDNRVHTMHMDMFCIH